MKRTVIYKVFSVVMLTLAVFNLTSCADKEQLPKEEPIFPEMQALKMIEPGEEIRLGITPNLDWEISIPEESSKWFKILEDGKFPVTSVKGKASKLRIYIKIWTTDEESFDLRSCKVYLTMGGKTQAIAEYMLEAKERVLEVYPANMGEDGFEKDGDNYVFSETQITDGQVIELLWNSLERKYYYPINVKSNFNWDVQWPLWARADIAIGESRVGEFQIEVYGVDKYLPLDEEQEGVIAFMAGNNVIKEIKVKIPSSADIFEYNLGGYSNHGSEEAILTFDHATYLHTTSGSYTKELLEGYIYGPQASRSVVLYMVDGKYTSESGATWVKLQENGPSGPAVLQERDLSLSVEKNMDNAERSALIMILPATAPSHVSDLLTSDMTQVKEEYSSYAIKVIQSGRPDGYITFEEKSEENLKNAGVLIETVKDLLPEHNFTFVEGCEGWQYKISYVKEYAETMSALYVTDPYAAIEIYDSEGNEIKDNLSEHWLAYTALGEGLYGQITVDKTKLPIVNSKPVSEADGYLVFKNYSGQVLSIVHFFYQEEKKMDEDVLEDASEILFKDRDKALLAGATAFEVVAGPTYDAFKGLQAPIYILTYKKNDTTLDINTNENATLFFPRFMDNKGNTPFMNEGPVMVTVDNQIYYDPDYQKLVAEFDKNYPNPTIEELQQFFPDPDIYDKGSNGFLDKAAPEGDDEWTYPGYSSINMKQPSNLPENAATPYKEILQFSDQSKFYMILICVLDI